MNLIKFSLSRYGLSIFKMASLVNLLIVFSVLFSFPVSAQESPGDIFELGFSEYQNTNYHAAITAFEVDLDTVSGCGILLFLEPDAKKRSQLNIFQEEQLCDFVNKDILWKVFVSIAYSHLSFGNQDDFSRWISNAKIINPSKRADPTEHPEEIVIAINGKPATDLDKGVAEYESGNYPAAIAKLRGVISRGFESGSVDLWTAHFYSGMSYFLQENYRKAIEEFIAAKETEQSEVPDATYYSPRIVSLYNSNLIVQRDICNKYNNSTCTKPTPPPPPPSEGMSTLSMVLIGLGVAALIGGGGGGGGGGGTGTGTVIVNW